MIKYSDDMPVANVTGSTIDDDLHHPLPDVPFNAHRLVDGIQIDARGLTVFYVDEFGTKHAIAGIGRQELNCAFSDKLRRSVDGIWRVETEKDLVSDIILAAEGAIDRVCDAVYTFSSSRNARYRQKYAEAVSYRDAGYPTLPDDADYPYLYREAAKRGVTHQELADSIIQRATAFDALGSIAEAARAELQGIGGEPDPQAAADSIVQTVRTAAGL